MNHIQFEEVLMEMMAVVSQLCVVNCTTEMPFLTYIYTYIYKLYMLVCVYISIYIRNAMYIPLTYNIYSLYIMLYIEMLYIFLIYILIYS